MKKITSYYLILLMSCCLVGLAPLKAAMSTHCRKPISTNVLARVDYHPFRYTAYSACAAMQHKHTWLRSRQDNRISPPSIHPQPKACYLALHSQQQRTQQSQTRWHYQTYAVGAMAIGGGLLLAQYKRADIAQAAYNSPSLPKQVSLSLLQQDMALLQQDISNANKSNISVYFDLAEGIVLDAERMIETARLSAMYLNDYVNERQISSYKRIQDDVLRTTKTLAAQHNVSCPDFVDNFSKEITIKKKGNSYAIALGGDPITQGVVDVFIELPGNLLGCCKLLLVDLPCGLVKLVDAGFGISAALGITTPLEKLVKEFKQNSDYFLTHYNTLSDDEVAPIKGIALFAASNSLQERLQMAMSRSITVHNRVIDQAVDLYFNMDSYIGLSDKKNIENSDKLGDCSFQTYQHAIAEVVEIRKKLRSELGLLRDYPDIGTRLDKWWDSKSDQEKLRTIGRGIGEVILFFYAGDMFAELIGGAGKIGSKLKSILKGSKAKKAIRLTELVEEGGISLQKASKLFNRGNKVRKVVLGMEELAQLGKIANAAEKIKMMEIVVDVSKINNVRKITQFTEVLTESFRGFEKATEICINVVNKQGSVTKILSTGVKHGNKGHWTTIWHNALKLAEGGEYSHIFLNKAFSTSAKFRKARIPSGFLKNRPDIWALGKNKNANLLLEVVSPSQMGRAARKALGAKTEQVAQWLVDSGLKVEEQLISIGDWCKLAR